MIITSITLSMTIPCQTTPSCYLRNQLGVSTIYLSTLSSTYLSFTVAYTYNRLELQYELLPPKPTGTYTYNKDVAWCSLGSHIWYAFSIVSILIVSFLWQECRIMGEC